MGGAAGAGVMGSVIGDVGAAGPGIVAFSDRRLKKDVKRIGDDPRGFGVYEFSYVWGPERYVGVMADEVKHIPGAVSDFYGLSRVNYGAL